MLLVKKCIRPIREANTFLLTFLFMYLFLFRKGEGGRKKYREISSIH